MHVRCCGIAHSGACSTAGSGDCSLSTNAHHDKQKLTRYPIIKRVRVLRIRIQTNMSRIISRLWTLDYGSRRPTSMYENPVDQKE